MNTKTQTFIKRAACLSFAALGLLAGARAQAIDPGWYVGGNVGQSSAKIDEDKIRGNLAAGGLTMTSISKDDREVGFKLFTGYQFTPHFALEAGYFNPGEFSYTAQTSPPGSQSGKMKLTGFFLDPVFTLPLTHRLSAFARLGANYSEADTSYTASGSASAPPAREKRSLNYKAGLGLEYDFTRNFGLRAELERYRIDDAVGKENEGDVDLASIGLVWRFVKGESARARARHARTMPVPPPVYVTVPAPARTVQYCSILDIEFEINLNEIQREEKERLAVLGTFLQKYPDTTAVIEGHTDNIGKPEDNMKLSQARADSVVAFLVKAYHVAPSRLQAVGYGDTRPIGDNDTEDGKRHNRRIGAVIACANDIEGLTVIPARVTMALDMEFDLNQAVVKPEYHEELARVARFLVANPTTTATVEGHTSNLTGTDEEAMELSERRAEAVEDYLVTNFAIPRSRLDSEGFGQTRRVSYNTSKEGQKENRRVNVIINYARTR